MRGPIIGLLIFFAIGFLALVVASAFEKDRMVVLSLTVGMAFCIATAWGVWQIIQRFEPAKHLTEDPPEATPTVEPVPTEDK